MGKENFDGDQIDLHDFATSRDSIYLLLLGEPGRRTWMLTWVTFAGARIVLDRLGEEGDVWIVGWVRDKINGKDSGPDLATNLIPSEVKGAFPKAIMVGEEFGTVLVRVEDSKGRNSSVR